MAQNLALYLVKPLEYPLDHCLAPDLLMGMVLMMGFHLVLMSDQVLGFYLVRGYMTMAQNLALNWEILLEYLSDHCLAPDLLTVRVPMMVFHLGLRTDPL